MSQIHHALPKKLVGVALRKPSGHRWCALLELGHSEILWLGGRTQEFRGFNGFALELSAEPQNVAQMTDLWLLLGDFHYFSMI